MSQPITRREALRRTVLFSTAALAAGRPKFLSAAPPETKFAPEGIHLLALGDYGTKGDLSQTAVAHAMSKFAKSLNQPLTAVLALGDNFYKKITDDRFEKHFEQMYSKENMDCPFYACLGNHDYGTAKYDFQEGKAQLQLDYAKNNPTSRWKMPAKWYTFELPNPEKPLVKFIVLDGNYWEGALTPKEKIAQRRFLEAELAKKTDAPWTWLINHFPIFSDGKGHGDNKRLEKEWGPALKDSPVSFCLAGHDHIMQHIQVDEYTPSFIVSGAGGASLYELNDPNRGYAENKFLGFNHFYVTPEEVHVQFINPAGECMHHFTRTPSGKISVVS